jgi:hypothetical protein
VEALSPSLFSESIPLLNSPAAMQSRKGRIIPKFSIFKSQSGAVRIIGGFHRGIRDGVDCVVVARWQRF